MIQLNTLESKFLDILEDKTSLKEFENWLYKNQETITAQSTLEMVEIYEELIQINFKTKESKHDLAKALNIDYEKLELFQIQQLIVNELENKVASLHSVKYELDVYELSHISFDFQIGNLRFRMHNPFEIENFVKLTDEERERIFSINFGSGTQFVKSILNSIGTENFRVYNWKKHEQTDRMTDAKIMQTKEDEYKIRIDGHYCHINKEYIKQKMKEAWL